jgi:hypothetical protein
MEAWRRRRLVKPSGRFAAVVGSGDDPCMSEDHVAAAEPAVRR